MDSCNSNPDWEGKWRDEDERKKVEIMRAGVEKQDPAAKHGGIMLMFPSNCTVEVDDATLRRFLRARDLNIQKSSNMLLKYLKWRRNEVPKGFISETEIQNELAQKKLFMQGFDKMDHPIGVILGRRHIYSKRDINEFRRSVVYGLDKLCSRMADGTEKVTFIADVEDWKYANCDIRAYLAALEIMQNYYPERLHKVFVVHVPSIFLKAWKSMYPFIDNNTKKKYIFVEDKKLKETLLEDIEESQLPVIYGGKLQLVPVEST